MGMNAPYDNIVPFPRRELDPVVEIFEISDEHPTGHMRRFDRCEDHIHVFADVPGRCQCGSEIWTTEA
jgi:hypothetical protein